MAIKWLVLAGLWILVGILFTLGKIQETKNPSPEELEDEYFD